jgi:transducin (beta)-like 1
MDEDDDNENNVDDEAENDTAMETDDRAGRRQIDHALDAAVVATMPGAQAAGLPQLVNGEYDKNGELLVTSSQSRAVGKGVPHSPHRNGGRSSESDGEPPPPHAEQPGGGLPEVDDTSTAALPDEILQLQMHESEVFMCAWNPVFTNLIATGSGDASARIWEMNEGTAKAGIHSVKTLPHGTDPLDKKNKDVTTLEWSSDGQFLATGSYDGIARVWARNGELLHTLRRHTGPIFSLKWNRKGNYILSGSYDTTAIVWDVSEPKPDPVVQQFTDHEAPTLDVDWRDNGTFATCSTDKKVHIYMVGMPKPLKVYSGHKDEVNAVKWDPSGRLLASCSDDSTAKVWEVDNDRDGPLYDFTSHTQEIYTVKWSPTGVGSSNPEMQSLLATASFDGTVRLWSVLDGSCFRIFDRHRDSVYSVAFSPSGKFLASGSLAGQMYIWNIERGEHVKSFKGSGDIFEVAWNKEETMVAACFSSNVVAIMDFDRASVIRKGSSS